VKKRGKKQKLYKRRIALFNILDKTIEISFQITYKLITIPYTSLLRGTIMFGAGDAVVGPSIRRRRA
jgi:hypothetical protein